MKQKSIRKASIKNGKLSNYICENDNCQAIVNTVYGTKLIRSKGKVIVPIRWLCDKCFYEEKNK